MRKVLVTLETDGLRDYVRLPDGHRKTMGTVSVLKFVTKVVPRREARRALDAFNATGSAVVTADLDLMEELFQPAIARMSADVASPLMDGPNRTSTRAEGSHIMADAKALLERLGQLEGVVTTLDKYAKEGGGLIAPKLHAGLRQMAGGLHFYNPGDQSKNNAWYISGEPKVDSVDGEAPSIPASVMHAPGAKTASEAPVVAAPAVVATPAVAAPAAAAAAPVAAPSYDSLKSNTIMAEGILNTVEETNTKVESLVTAGRKFNASKAQGDLYAIASRVTEIMNNVDLAQPWVGNDLTALAKQAKHIHSLFASAKV